MKPETNSSQTLLFRCLAFCFALLAVVMTSFACPFVKSWFAPDPPNIVFILADDLAYDDLGSYGSTLIQTPGIDALAAEGVSFTNAYTMGNFCIPTRISIMTGTGPMIGGTGSPTIGYTLQAMNTLPKKLKAAGYETFHLGKWHLGHDLEEHKPKGVGFDHYFGWPMAALPFGLPRLRLYDRPKLQRNEEAPEIVEGHLIDILTAEAIEIIQTHQSSQSSHPFFLNLWHFAPHSPIVPQERWAEQYPDTPAGKYAALVAGLDESVDRILRVLEESGAAENTIVIFTSDNGGTIEEHPDGIAHFRGFKTEYYEGGVKVPLIVRWPAQVTAGVTRTEIVTSVDFFPTLLEIARGEESKVPIDGRSFLHLLLSSKDVEDGRLESQRTLFWPHQPDVATLLLPIKGRAVVRKGDWKLTLIPNAARFDPVELYNLANDPSESNNLVDEHEVLVAELRQQYMDRRREVVGHIKPVLQVEGEVEDSSEEGVFDFSSSKGFVRIAHSPVLNLVNNTLCLSIDVKPEPASASSAQWIAGKGSQWQFRLLNGGLEFSFERFDGSVATLQSLDALKAGEWSSVGFDVNNIAKGSGGVVETRYKLRVNRKVVATGSFSATYEEGQHPVRVGMSDVTIGNNPELSMPFMGEMRNPEFNQKK